MSGFQTGKFIFQMVGCIKSLRTVWPLWRHFLLWPHQPPAPRPSLCLCGQYSADCKQRTRWRIWKTTSLILCFLVSSEEIKKGSSLTAQKLNWNRTCWEYYRKISFHLKISIWKRQNVPVLVSSFSGFMRKFLITPWLHVLEWAAAPSDTELKSASFTFKLCRPLGLQSPSLLSEGWWTFFYLPGSFSSW